MLDNRIVKIVSLLGLWLLLAGSAHAQQHTPLPPDKWTNKDGKHLTGLSGTVIIVFKEKGKVPSGNGEIEADCTRTMYALFDKGSVTISVDVQGTYIERLSFPGNPPRNRTITHVVSGNHVKKYQQTWPENPFDSMFVNTKLGVARFPILSFFNLGCHVEATETGDDAKPPHSFDMGGSFVTGEYPSVISPWAIDMPSYGALKTPFSDALNALGHKAGYTNSGYNSWIEAAFDGTSTRGKIPTIELRRDTPKQKFFANHPNDPASAEKEIAERMPGTLDVSWNLNAKPINITKNDPTKNNPGNSNSGKSSPPIKCPKFLEMQAEAKKMQSLADTLEKDNRAYEAAVADVCLRGYNSPLCSLGLNVSEDQIPNLLCSKSAVAAAHQSIIASIRSKANTRDFIAQIGLMPQPDYSLNGTASKSVIQWFCDPDPKNIGRETWEALYRAGYIDYTLYRSKLLAKWIADPPDIIKEVGGLALLIAGSEFIAARFAVADILINTRQVRVLRDLTGRRLSFSSAEEIGTLISTEDAEAVNASGREEYIQQGGDPSKYIPQWKERTVVQKMVARVGFRVYRVFAKGETKPRGEWVTPENLDGLSIEEIAEKLSLPFTPSHVIEVEVEQGVEFWLGFAKGGGRQIRVLDKSKVNPLQETQQPLPLPVRTR